MNSIHDISEKNGLILHADGCSFLLEECERVYSKLKKRIAKQEEKRKAEFAEIFSYRSVDEICDAYGYGYITDSQRRKYIEIFEKGQAALDEPLENKYTAALDVLLRIMKQLRFEIEQDRFDALSPEEQQAEIRRSEENLKTWKAHKQEIKKLLKMEE